MYQKKAWWICAALAAALLAVGCKSVGSGSYVGRNEFNNLTNRVGNLESSVDGLKAQIKSTSPAALASGAAARPNQPTTNRDDPFSVLFSENTTNFGNQTPDIAVASHAPAPPPVSGNEKTVYERGQSLLKQKKYDESARVFQQMLDQNPGGRLAPNARYWLGECFYATGRYSEAAAEFQRCADDYPDSAKAPDSLLKLSYSYDRLGDGLRAMAVMDLLLTTFPQSEAATKIRKGQGHFQG